MEILVLYLAVGAVAGVLAGLLGVGGGLVIVPALMFSFQAQGFEPAVLMHMAVGTSLLTIVFTSLSSIRAHHRRGAVIWALVRRLAPGIVVGGLLGAAIADLMPGEILRRVFAVFVLLVAAELGFGSPPAPHRALPGALGMGVAGVVIGAVSAVVGIGGGSLTVPFLAWCNVAVRSAVAVSAACGLPIALSGSLGFLLTGLGEAGLPTWSTGYLYWPAMLGIAVASVLTAPYGARLAHQLPGDVLRRVFAVFLAAVGARLLFS